jgi:hypothetical protein
MSPRVQSILLLGLREEVSSGQESAKTVDSVWLFLLRVEKAMPKVIIAAIVFQAWSLPAESSPTFLGGFDVKGDVVIPTPSKSSVRFILDIANEDQGPFALVTPFLKPGETTVLPFSAGQPEDFEGFAGLVTNGTNDAMRFLWTWENDSCPFPCTGQGGWIQDIDFASASIESILLTVHEISIIPLHQLGAESRFSFDVSYDVFGTPTPDSSTCFLLLLGLAFKARKRPNPLSDKHAR